MPGSISTSKTFSSGTNLKHKQQCYTQTFNSQLKRQKELEQGQNCLLVPIQKEDDVLRKKKNQERDRTTKGLLRQFANQLCVYLMGQLICVYLMEQLN